MSSKTSSRSTFTMVPSTMSPSLKYLMVSSIAARKASSDPMSLTATWGVEVTSVLLVMCGWTPDTDIGRIGAPRIHATASPHRRADFGPELRLRSLRESQGADRRRAHPDPGVESSMRSGSHTGTISEVELRTRVHNALATI